MEVIREQGGLTRNPERPMNLLRKTSEKCAYINLCPFKNVQTWRLASTCRMMTTSTRKYAILLLATLAGTAACAPPHVSHRGQVTSLRSSQSSDSFSSDTVSYCNIAFNALQSAASMNNDGEADTRKKMKLRRHKLSRTVELWDYQTTTRRNARIHLWH